MLSPAPQPPPDHYVWFGRVMHACSMLELQIGLIGWASKNGYHYTEDWSEVAGGPGVAWRDCDAQTELMAPELARDVRAFLDEARPIRDERNKFAHAVFVLDPAQSEGDQWILRSARDVEFRPLTAELGARLVSSANRLSQRAMNLRQRAAADSVSRRA